MTAILAMLAGAGIGAGVAICFICFRFLAWS